MDPAKESDSAKTLIEQGASVILQNTNLKGPPGNMETAGKGKGFGQGVDIAGHGP